MDFLSGPNLTTRVLIRGRQEIRGRRRIWPMEAEKKGNVIGGKEPRTEGSLQKLEMARKTNVL